MQKLNKCAAESDMAGALGVLGELQTAPAGTMSKQMCAILIHLLSSATPPRLAEAELAFELVRQGGEVPDEPCWSGLVRLQCAAGELTAAAAAIAAMRAAGVAMKLRSISPLISAACARGERPAAAEACATLRSCRISPTAVEFIPLLAMHADADASSFRDTLRWMCDEEPPLSAAAFASLRAALGGGGGEAAAGGGGCSGGASAGGRRRRCGGARARARWAPTARARRRGGRCSSRT